MITYRWVDADPYYHLERVDDEGPVIVGHVKRVPADPGRLAAALRKAGDAELDAAVVAELAAAADDRCIAYVGRDHRDRREVVAGAPFASVPDACVAVVAELGIAVGEV